MRNDPTGRALRLLSLLQTHRFWRAAELAERLGVTQRTVRRDIDRLRDLDYPVDSTSGKYGGVLAAACRDRECVRFIYRGRDGEGSRRIVEPHQLVTAGRRWYLVAWDQHRRDWRTFRLDRLRETGLAGSHFTTREVPGGDAASFVASSLGSTLRHHDATLAVHAPLAELAGVLRWIDHTPIELGADHCFIQIHSEDLGRLAMTVARLALSAPVTVIEPTELADTVSELALHLSVS
jgi:predicted DNA-binding transcriptional regulator YafY